MPPLPTGAELEILMVLWRAGPSTVREVHEALDKSGSYTTTLKQMQVMHEKRLLRRTERFRSHVYEPAVGKDQVQQRMAGDLLHRVFEGSAKNLVLGALRARPASERELAEIRRMIGEFEKKRKSK
jgi:BlaI family transcriptional regulator, penicillinase repressor